MNYTKPEIVAVGSAAGSIQSGQKPFGPILDVNPVKHQTSPAYEADE